MFTEEQYLYIIQSIVKIQSFARMVISKKSFLKVIESILK